MKIPALNIPQPESHRDWKSFASALTVALRQYEEEMRGYLDAQTDLVNYADDTAAATGGVGVQELYRTGSIVKVRVS